VIAIAADAVKDTAGLQAKLPALTLLTDPTMAAVAAWGLRFGDADEPWPATFIVNGAGTITWRYVGAKGKDWPAYDDLAAALAK